VKEITFVSGFGAVFTGEIIATFTSEAAVFIDARSTVPTVHVRTETYRRQCQTQHSSQTEQDEICDTGRNMNEKIKYKLLQYSQRKAASLMHPTE